MADMEDSFVRQLDDVIRVYEDDSVLFITRATAAIERIAGSESTYAKQAQRYTIMYTGMDRSTAAALHGIIQALRADVIGGFLKSAKELIHAELFSDFLDMAGYLLSEGYKDAAAVMASGVLESHLHQLCNKKGIDLANAVGIQKKASQLNDELYKEKVYGMADQKSVTAWLDIRNKAAHSKYSEYTKDHVDILILSVKGFITRCPA